MGNFKEEREMEHILGKLSDLGKNLQGSEIRRLFAISMRPGVISFAGGLPDPGSFPASKVADVVNELLSTQGDIYLQYGGSRGTDQLNSAISELLKKRSISATKDEIIVTNGSQQAVNIVSSVFLDPGDTVFVENPTFIGALGVFRNAKANILGIPMDDGGVEISELRHRAHLLKKEGRPAKLMYLIPNFQNPTGLTLAQDRRQEILDIASEFDMLVLEDDPYGQLWFEGGPEMVKPIKAYDRENRILYTSSFSKIIAPGLRLGWIVAPQPLIERFDMAKQMIDVCSPPLLQGIGAELATSGYLDSHIEKLRFIYKSRCDAMLKALEQQMPDGVEWTIPKGGFFVWVTLPESVNALEMLPVALEKDVAYVIGSAFYADGSGKNTLRLSFCHEDEDTIHEGIRRLGEAVSEYIK